MISKDDIRDFKDYIDKSSNIVIFTGAGILQNLVFLILEVLGVFGLNLNL